MTCQDNCLYYPLCRDSGFLMYHTRINKTITLTENAEKECPFKKFKNKADFVEVVRCKDCAYFKQSVSALFPEVNCFICDHPYGMKKNITENYFCSCGERMAGV